MIRAFIQNLRRNARAKRANIFLNEFELKKDTRILDLGCGDGSNMASLLQVSPICNKNIFAADIGPNVEKVAAKYGFTPVRVPESGQLPFSDKHFDIVFCSSVIEHVTVPKGDEWKWLSGSEFKAYAKLRQKEFAAEIERLGNEYFVQTPNRSFLIESHSWLPIVGWLPRRLLIPILKISNKYWIKKTSPDWCLLTKAEMSALFPTAEIRVERFLGFAKSIIALKTK